MREIGIPKKTHEVKAILEGRQTQDRRPIKPQPELVSVELEDKHHFLYKGRLWRQDTFLALKAPWQLGDWLYVRETFAGPHPHYTEDGYIYKADCDAEDESYRQDYLNSGSVWAKWKPSIHMPKSAARIWLLVEDVWVERIQDISEEDAKAEGVQTGIFRDGPNTMKGEFQLETHYKGSPTGSYRDGFKFLWHQLYGRESWDRNDWVWCSKFKLLSTTGKPETVKQAI